MIVTRLGVFSLLATIAIAQQTSAIPEPKLPVIDDDACPGKNRVVESWRVFRKDKIYSSWKANRIQVGTLKAGERTTVLAGIEIVRRPDRLLVTQPISDLALQPGDVVLRYSYKNEDSANIWAKGHWHRGYQLETSETLPKGSGCQQDCNSVVSENGVKEWWVQVKIGAGATGWVLAFKLTHDLIWDDGNFGALCAD